MTENPYRPPAFESHAWLEKKSWDHSQKSRMADVFEILGWFFLYYLATAAAAVAIAFIAAAIRLLLS